MPALPRPSRAVTITLPPREAMLAAATKVLVVGGGPAGIGAALGAAEAGAEVILAERYGFLGGNATAALVMPLMSFHTQRATLERPGAAKLFPTDHGPGEPVVAGALAKLLGRLVRAGGAIRPRPRPAHGAVRSRAVQARRARTPGRPGVQLLFHTFASDVEHGGPVQGVVFETKSGPLVIRARVVVDCTGDADVATRAGAPYELGREQDGLVQPMTLMFRMVQFKRAGFEAYVAAHPEQWRGVHGLWDLIRKATAAGELDLPREDILFFGTPHEGEVSVNSTRVMRVSAPTCSTGAAPRWRAAARCARSSRSCAATCRDSSALTSRRAGCTRAPAERSADRGGGGFLLRGCGPASGVRRTTLNVKRGLATAGTAPRPRDAATPSTRCGGLRTSIYYVLSNPAAHRGPANTNRLDGSFLPALT